MPSYKRLDKAGASQLVEEIFAKVKTVTDSIEGGGSGDANAVDMTYAQYQALTQEQQMDGTIRFITDINNADVSDLPRAEGVGF